MLKMITGINKSKTFTHEKQCKLQNKKFQYFTFLFINYHCIVDSEKCPY